MSPSAIISIILYVGVLGSIGSTIILLLYLLIESKKLKSGSSEQKQ